MKNDLRKKAVELRKRGLSYTEISSILPTSKSTLSSWLRNVKLGSAQQNRLTQRRLKFAYKGAMMRKNARIHATKQVCQASEKEIGKINSRELLLIGACLYWAEGSKQKETNISSGVIFGNSDIHMIKIFLIWLDTICNVPLQNIKFELYIHESADISSAVDYWRSSLFLEDSIDIIIRLKRHTISPKRKNIGSSYHGLMRLTVRKSTFLNRKITGWINGISNAWGVV